MAEKIDSEVDKSTKDLAQKSLEYMQAQYNSNNLGGHVGNLNVSPYKHKYKSGFVLSSGDDEIAIYKEFGTGIVGYNKKSKLATDTGYQYNIGVYKGTIPDGAIKEYGRAYCEEHTDENTWWYRKNNKWWHTKGMEGDRMYDSLVEELRLNTKKRYKTAVSQAINNYKSTYNGGNK